MSKDAIGETNKNSKGTEMKIVGFRGNRDIDVRFLDEHGVVVRTTYQNFKRGSVRNPYDITVRGVGYLGEGPYKTRVDGKLTDAYDTWDSILDRCYSPRERDRYRTYYHICTVCKEWFNYQAFARWYNDNWYPCEGRLHIDKDILVKGNKVYSPEKCILIPQRFNMIFMSKERSVDADLPCGVHRTRTSNKYVVEFNRNYLGTFDSAEEAAIAHETAKRNYIRSSIAEYELEYRLPDKVRNALLAW